MKTLEDILAEYDAQRNRVLAKREHEQSKLYQRLPRLKELQQQKDSLLLAQLQDVLHRPGKKEEILATSHAQAQQIQAEMDALLEREGAPVLPSFRCPRCQDTGFLRVNHGRTFCSCLLQRIYTDLYGGLDPAKLPGSFSTFDPAIFSTQPIGITSQSKRMHFIYKYAKSYVADFPENPQRTVLFIGGSGLGKSFLLSAIAKELQKKTETLLYLSSFSLFEVFHRHRLGELSLLEPLYEAQVLIVDDLGTEPMTQNVTLPYFFQLLERRLATKRHTFFATNLDEDQLKQRYTEKVSSRLLARDSSSVIHFIGEDLRLQ